MKFNQQLRATKQLLAVPSSPSADACITTKWRSDLHVVVVGAAAVVAILLGYTVQKEKRFKKRVTLIHSKAHYSQKAQAPGISAALSVMYIIVSQGPLRFSRSPPSLLSPLSCDTYMSGLLEVCLHNCMNISFLSGGNFTPWVIMSNASTAGGCGECMKDWIP